MSTSNPFLDFTDAHLKAAMLRALRTVAVMTAILFVTLFVTLGWASAMLLLAGAIVSGSGLWEWQKLIGVINAKLDAQAAAPGAAAPDAAGYDDSGPLPEDTPRSTSNWRVVVSFFLRLLIAGAILYGSLRCFHGSVYALIGGLGLGVLALGIEAVRLVRS